MMSEERPSPIRRVGRSLGLPDKAMDAIGREANRGQQVLARLSERSSGGRSEADRKNAEVRTAPLGLDASSALSPDWAYDPKEWAWATLVAVRELTRNSMVASLTAREIRYGMANALELTDVQRGYKGAVNNEDEYATRCSTMRILLIECKVLRQESKEYYLTDNGRSISRENFNHSVAASLPQLDKVPKGTSMRKYRRYRGDPEFPSAHIAPSQISRQHEAEQDQLFSSAPKIVAVGIPEYAWEIVQVLRKSDQGGASIDEIHELVAEELGISRQAFESQTEEPTEGKETSHQYRMRRALNSLLYEAKAIRKDPVNPENRQLTVLGRTISQATVIEKAEKSERERPSQPRYDEFQSGWSYDHRLWAWRTLEAIRDIQHSGVSGNRATNGNITSRVVEKFALGPKARKVESKLNAREMEYAARCATMRVMLNEIRLIKRDAGQPDWQLLPLGENIEPQEFEARLKSADLNSPTAKIQANSQYRGNPDLEQVMDLEKSEYSGQIVVDRRISSQDTNGISNDQHDHHAQHDSVFHLTDRDLCAAVLRIIPDSEDGAYMEQKAIVAEVVDEMKIPDSYLQEERPPWGTKEERKSIRNLLEYRIELALRAMSIGQSGLVRDGGLDHPDNGNRWFRTARSRHQTLDESPQGEYLWKTIEPFFAMHSYEDWHTEDWHKEFEQTLIDLSGRDGTPFEHLVKMLLQKEQEIMSGEKDVIVQGGYLDHAGIDITAKIAEPSSTSDSKFLLGKMAFPEPETQILGVLLVQVKRSTRMQVGAGVPSKTFGFAARLRSQAYRGELGYNVVGARLVIFGDLTRDAEWEFWTTKAAWEALEREENDRNKESGTPQPDLRWDLWDGATVLRKIEEHKIGVRVDNDGQFSVDEAFLALLPSDPNKK